MGNVPSGSINSGTTSQPIAVKVRRPSGPPEPLPPESPLWLHPKVTVMPHVARRPTVRQLVTEIAANVRSLRAGGRMLQEIDKTMGY